MEGGSHPIMSGGVNEWPKWTSDGIFKTGVKHKVLSMSKSPNQEKNRTE